MAKLTPEACRAGRALLNWTQGDLVRAAGMSATTVAKVELGKPVGEDTAAKIIATFEVHGVELLNHNRPGARLRRTTLKETR